MSNYPLIVRNRIPLVYRGFMLLFLGGVALATYVSLRDGPPEPHRLWPWFMAVFWVAGLFGLRWTLDQEVSVIRITNPRSIHIHRGKVFRRQEHWTDRARFWIDQEEDSDGDPYFKLRMDAPGGALTISESHHREKLEELQAKIEAAVSGAVYSGNSKLASP